MKNLLKWIVRLIFSDFDDYFLYTLLIFSLIFFDVALYYSVGDMINKYLLLTILWFAIVLFTALLIFKIVIKFARETFRENMSIFEVVAFIEAKRRSEELKRRGIKPEIIVAGEEEKKEKEEENKKRKGLIERILDTFRKKESESTARKESTEERRERELVSNVPATLKQELLETKQTAGQTEARQEVRTEQNQKEAVSKTNKNESKATESEQTRQDSKQEPRQEAPAVEPAEQVEQNVEQQELPSEVKFHVVEESKGAPQETKQPAPAGRSEDNQLRLDEGKLQLVEEILKMFEEVMNDEKLLKLVAELLQVYAVEPDLNSLGFVPDDDKPESWHALAKIPLLLHVANVVSHAKRLAEEKRLPQLEKVALMLAALVHDIGKVDKVREVVGAKTYEVHKHAEYGYKFLSTFFSEKAEEGELPYSQDWFDNVALAVKYHHTVVPSGKPEWFNLLKKADWLARREETGLSEEELREVYKNLVKDFSNVDEEETNALIVEAFKAGIVNKIRQQLSFAYPVNANVPVAFFGVDESGEAFIYIDPENLLRFLAMSHLGFKTFAKGYKTKRVKGKEESYYNNEIKKLVSEALWKAGYAAIEEGRYSNVLVFENTEKIEKVKKKGFSVRDGQRCIMAVPLKVSAIASEIGVSVKEIIEAVSSAVRKHPSNYYIGNAYDENADRRIAIPCKEVVEEFC